MMRITVGKAADLIGVATVAVDCQVTWRSNINRRNLVNRGTVQAILETPEMFVVSVVKVFLTTESF